MSNPAGEGVPLSDEQLLLDALDRRPGAWAKLIAGFESFLWAIAKRRLPDLPTDVQSEFIQEVWMRVGSRASEDFTPPSVSARDFIAQFASAAINKVRADYCPPGQRTRRRTAGNELVPLPDIGLLQDDRAMAAFEAAAARIDLERLMAVAEAAARNGMELMRDEDLTVTEAARRIGMPRETYRRRLRSLPATLARQLAKESAAMQGQGLGRASARGRPGVT